MHTSHQDDHHQGICKLGVFPMYTFFSHSTFLSVHTNTKPIMKREIPSGAMKAYKDITVTQICHVQTFHHPSRRVENANRKNFMNLPTSPCRRENP